MEINLFSRPETTGGSTGGLLAGVFDSVVSSVLGQPSGSDGPGEAATGEPALVATRGPDAEQKFRACQGFFDDLERIMGSLGHFNQAGIDLLRDPKVTERLMNLLTDAFSRINMLDSPECEQHLTEEQKAQVEKHKQTARELFGKLMIQLHESGRSPAVPAPQPDSPNFFEQALKVIGFLLGLPGRIFNPVPNP